MPRSYLKRMDVQYPQQANPKDNYGVKIIEADTPAELQTAVNSFLFSLTQVGAAEWFPHIVSTQYANYATSGPPSVTHVCTITLYLSGTLTSPYSG